jgi:hypothetical protein
MSAEPISAVASAVRIHDSALIIVTSGGTRDLDVMLADPASRKSLRFLRTDISDYSARTLLLFHFAFDHAGGGNESHKIVVSQGSAPPLQVAEQAHYPV